MHLFPLVLLSFLLWVVGGVFLVMVMDHLMVPQSNSIITGYGVAAIVGDKNGHRWASIGEGLVIGISMSVGRLYYFVCVGSLSVSWMLSRHRNQPQFIIGLKLTATHVSSMPLHSIICAVVGDEYL